MLNQTGNAGNYSHQGPQLGFASIIFQIVLCVFVVSSLRAYPACYPRTKK